MTTPRSTPSDNYDESRFAGRPATTPPRLLLTLPTRADGEFEPARSGPAWRATIGLQP
jgi:hypothetical protein